MKKKIKKTKEADFELTPVPAERLIAFTKWLMKQSNEPPPEEVKEMSKEQIRSIALTMLGMFHCDKCFSYTCFCRRETPNEFFERANSKQWDYNREAIENEAKEIVYYDSMYNSAWRDFSNWDLEFYSLKELNKEGNVSIGTIHACNIEIAEDIARKLYPSKHFPPYKIVEYFSD